MMRVKPAAPPPDIAAISAMTGHAFVDGARLARALTHASAAPATSVRSPRRADYERLEFLGDRVLGLAIAELLMELYPQAGEGELSVRLNALVNAEVCAALADEIGITPHIITGAEIASASAAKLVNLRADVMESVIAAIFLDGGMDAARRFIRRFWEKRARIGAAIRRDPKTELQEWAQRETGSVPAYAIVSRDGPDHAPMFMVEVCAGTRRATATGASRKEAEREAATVILVAEGIWSHP
ncbi:MAG: ribonuclease III [Rhizobiaceae bacterium]|jgi:ribonuclease-3|nr:ribonuclease III [Rhizobiaceae bacterium]